MPRARRLPHLLFLRRLQAAQDKRSKPAEVSDPLGRSIHCQHGSRENDFTQGSLPQERCRKVAKNWHDQPSFLS